MTEEQSAGRSSRNRRLALGAVLAVVVLILLDPFGMRGGGDAPVETSDTGSQPRPQIEPLRPGDAPIPEGHRLIGEEQEEIEEPPAPEPEPRVPTIAELRDSGWDASSIPEHESSNETRVEYVRLLRLLSELHTAEEPDNSAITNAENELVHLLFAGIRKEGSTWGMRRRGITRRIGFAGDDPAKLEQTFRDFLYKVDYTDANNQNRARWTTEGEVTALAEAFGWEDERDYRLFLQEIFLSTKHLSRTGVQIFDDTDFWPQK